MVHYNVVSVARKLILDVTISLLKSFRKKFHPRGSVENTRTKVLSMLQSPIHVDLVNLVWKQDIRCALSSD